MNSFDDWFDIDNRRARILVAAYPTARVSAGTGELEWVDIVGDALEDAENREIVESAERDEEYRGKYVAAIDGHCESIVDETIDALRLRGTVADIQELIDAAAKKGSAFMGNGSAGRFLERIASLALKQIKQEGEGTDRAAANGSTGEGDEQGMFAIEDSTSEVIR